jgi:hypothetical protein
MGGCGKAADSPHLKKGFFYDRFFGWFFLHTRVQSHTSCVLTHCVNKPKLNVWVFTQMFEVNTDVWKLTQDVWVWQIHVVALSFPSAAWHCNAWQWLIVASSAKQKHQRYYQQLTSDSTPFWKLLRVQTTWTYFNLSTVSFGSILANNVILSSAHSEDVGYRRINVW